MKLLLNATLLAAMLTLTAGDPHSPYGICAHVSRLPEWNNADRELQTAKAGGIDWVRTDFDWKYIQKSPGQWDYSHLDSLLKTAKKHNVKLLPILGYDVKWAVPVYRNLDLWREYVRRTVSRYAEDLRYWEVWNEANLTNGPDYTRLNAEQYTELLKAAYEEIKKIDPDLQVLYTGTGGVPIPFIEATLKAGSAQYFDIMNLHPYQMQKQPETLRELIAPLFALFRKYNVKKPVWATEFSWPTHQTKSIAVPVLDLAIRKLGLNPETVPVAVIRNPAMEQHSGKEFAAEDFTQKLFPRRKEISPEDLKNLEPETFPVLVPSLTEEFPRKYFNDVVDYVRRGGILILCVNGFPFYYDAVKTSSGTWKRLPEDSRSLLKALHIEWLAAWRDKVPKKGTVSLASGGNFPVHIPGGERYLSTKNMKKGDTFLPILVQSNGTFSAPVAGIYKLNSDLKGTIIMSVAQRTTGVSQEIQGKFLVRSYLTLLSSGIETVFWYKLLAEETNLSGIGAHFGIVHRDLTPREAFTAHRFLTRMLPPGSSRPVLKQKKTVYSVFWTRPDGRKVHAFWTTGEPKRIRIPFPVQEACGHLGEKKDLSGTEFSVSDAPVYLIEQ